MQTLRFHVRTAALVGLTGGGAWLGACALVVLGARRVQGMPRRGPPRPALVLGCRPGPALARRVDAAAALYVAGHADRIVVSGRGEADWGAARLEAHGVPSVAIAQENLARNTWENLSFARPLLGGRLLYLVTDRWHLPRATLVAQAVGLSAIGVEAPAPLRPLALVREGLSVVQSVSGGHLSARRWLSLALGRRQG